MLWQSDYFRGYRDYRPHPHMPATGTEGRCEVCGGRGDNRMHDEPWVRLTEAELQAEARRERERNRPLIPFARPTFAWDGGAFKGEGRAGDYLNHVRTQRKERMQTTFLITIDSPHLTLETMRALLDLNETEGVSVEAYSRPRAEVAQERLTKAAAERDATKSHPSPLSGWSTPTFTSSTPSEIRDYLDKAVLSSVHVTITYYSDQTNKTTTRVFAPARIDDGLYGKDYVIGRDVDKNAVRSLIIQNIQYIEGPAL